MPVDDPLTLEALAACTEVPQRTIRYYIQRGLVPRPHGEKKGAYYDTIHVEALLQIRQWIGAGMSLDAIHALLHEGQTTDPLVDLEPPEHQPMRPQPALTYSLAQGLTLHLDLTTCPLSDAEITAWLQRALTTFPLDTGASR